MNKKLLFAIALLWSCLGAPSAKAADQSLVGHWKLDEGTGVIAQDSSPFAAPGQLINGPQWVRGTLGNALSFDGVADYVDVGNPDHLHLISNMTIALWVYADRLSTETDVLITKNGGFGDVGWHLYIEGGFPAMKIGHPNPFSKTSTRTASLKLSLGRWYHIAGVYNASARTMDMYVDGVLSNGLFNGTVPPSQRNSGQNINIARRSNERRHFRGMLDDIRIYSRALSAQELETLAGSEDTTPEQPFSEFYEAERSVFLSRLIVAADPDASSGAYIGATSGKPAKSPAREGFLPFSIMSEGTYYLWARLKAFSAQNDAIYIGIDNSWDRVYPKVKNSYQWVRIKTSTGSTEYGFSLAAGQHVLQIGHAEIGARLDSLFLTNDPSEVPR
jgi:hypothetical protein